MIASAMILISLISEDGSVPRVDKVIRQLQGANVDFARDSRGNIVYMGAGLTDEVIGLVAPLGTLLELDCTGTKVTDAGLLHLKGSKSLRKLDARCSITGKGIAHLESCPSLEYLVVEPRKDVEATVRNIGRLRKLRELYLYGDAELRPEWCESWKNLKLRKFATEGTQFGDEHLKRLEAIQSLEEVVFDSTPITDNAIESLLKMKHLQDLCLADQPLTDAALTRLRALPKLTQLNLGGTNITSRGLTELCKDGRLRSLFLMDTEVDDQAIGAICANRHLEFLAVSGTRVSERGVRRLRAALPKCQVGSDFDD